MGEHSINNASSVMMGFQFQVNVAIYFMFKYLKEINFIRVEGESEDIEVYFTDKSKFMIQSKAQTVNINDNTNNNSKLKKSLSSLAKADSANVKRLYYASNIRNPVNSETGEFEKYDIAAFMYNDLSPESQEKIDEQINNLGGISIDKNKLAIIRIPFFGEIEEEKYKYIVQTARDVLSIMNENLSYKSNAIVHFMENKFYNNGTAKKETKISKEEFCNWIILKEIETMEVPTDKIGIDEADSYEAYNQYRKFIDEKASSYECYSKVFSLFEKYRRNRQIGYSQFVNEAKLELYNYFFENEIKNEENINEETLYDIYVAQIISYFILIRKGLIEKVREGANL